MRKKRTAQASIYEVFAPHDIGRELQAMSDWLDEHREVLDWVARDVRRRGVKPTGRSGLSVESVLRCALLKQHRQLSYEELAFHLYDSASFGAFARLPMHWCPKKSALQRVVSAIRPQTWERINGVLMDSARKARFEPGERVRIDSTVTDSPIHEPSDSSLLWDGVRVLVRLLEDAQELPGAPALYYVNHGRVAKKRARAIFYTRGSKKRTPLYRDLLKVTRATLGYVEAVGECLQRAGVWGIEFEGWLGQAQYYKPLIERVISQTERRVFDGESVPASEKVVSLFEPHTDIIVKGAREVRYGHKVNLATQGDGFITYLNIEDGNPADKILYTPVLDACHNDYNKRPVSVVADGGYASQANVTVARASGVKRAVFNKRVGLGYHQMGVKKKTFEVLKNFRAGIEGNISELKRAFGMGKANWKGHDGFKAYVWSAVLTYNLIRMVRFSSA